MSSRLCGGRQSPGGADRVQSDDLETGVSRRVSSFGDDLGSPVDPLTSMRLLQPPFYLFGDRLGGKSKVLLDVLVRSGSAEGVPTDHQPVGTHHAAPWIAASDLDDGALGAARQNQVAVGRVLPAECFP